VQVSDLERLADRERRLAPMLEHLSAQPRAVARAEILDGHRR